MANYELNKDGQYISYPSLDLLLKGGKVGDVSYPKVDMSLWDQVTMCGTCHVGGAFYEHDRQGNRLPARLFADWGAAMVGRGAPSINPITSTVWENYDATTGADQSFGTFTPWAYPQYYGNKPANGPMMAPYGWGMTMKMQDPNTGVFMNVTSGQLMTPNVKEMDCLFCHLKGYDHIMASVMNQAGSLNASPAAGAGLFDMLPISTTFMGYNGYDAAKNPNGTVTFGPVTPNGQTVSLTDGMVSRILAQPDSENCLQCHGTKTLKNMPEMFGTTGTSVGFLSAMPMVFDPTNPIQFGPTGKRMPAYDINAMWLSSGSSDKITANNFMGYMMPGLSYLQAMWPTPYNASGYDPKFNLGGGNKAGTGPLYYMNADTDNPDQRTLKLSIGTFARAEWFKRGDTWQAGQDVHSSFGCAGCHFTGDSTHKNQCDPGRGHDMMSGIEDGVPPLKNRNLVTSKLGGFNNYSGLQTPDKHDTRNTVKRCEFCHITKKDFYGQILVAKDANGNIIDGSFGAPNPTTAHQDAGLLANVVQIVDQMDIHGTFGGQGISKFNDFTHDKTKLGTGNHLDVMDCTVCHVQKKAMVVRALDATSGNRYPSVIGTDLDKGMMGLFEDPAPDNFNAGVVQKYNGIFKGVNDYFNLTAADTGTLNPADGKYYIPIKTGSTACNNIIAQAGANWPAGFTCEQMASLPKDNPMFGMSPAYQNLIPAGTHVVGGNLKEWKPLRVWQKLGNMEAPLTTDLTSVGLPNFSQSGKSQISFRRKIYLANAIVAAIWNNTDSAVDANGDGAPGGKLNYSKQSLTDYKDIFSGDPLDMNNAQGFDEPIFDPWIMHDLKAGFNFGPSALSVISIGFGGFGTPAGVDDPTKGKYQSAFMPDGTFVDGAYKYVSVWSGAVILTEPQQIRDYKLYRNAVAAGPTGDGKSWTGTELGYIGDPFMVTHGIKPVATHVVGSPTRGNGCADCHSSGAGFFTGDYTMTGTALPADRTFNPTARLKTTSDLTKNDANDNYPVLDAYGDPIRNPGVPGLEGTGTFFERPLEPFRVKAYKGDLRTAFEGFNKLGQPRSSKFEKDVPCDKDDAGTGCTVTTPLERADVLYPEDDGAIYYKFGDVDPTGAPKPGATAMTGREWATYLTDSTKFTTAAFIDPNTKVAAQIASVAGIGITPGTGNGNTTSVDAGLNTIVGAVTVSVYKGSTPTLLANTTTVATHDDQGNVVEPSVVNATNNIYKWTMNDGAALANAASPSINPATPVYGSSADGTNLVLTERTLYEGTSNTFTLAAAPPTTIDATHPDLSLANTPTGTYRLTLTVTNPVTGISKQDIQFIRVFDKAVDTAMPTNWVTYLTDTTGGGKTTLTFDATKVPASSTYNKVKIAWGDGSYSEVNGNLGSTIAHVYTRSKAYYNPTKTGYTFKTFFSFIKTGSYNGYATSKVVQTATQQVDLGLASNLVTTVRVTKPKLNGVYNVKKGTNTIVVLTVTNKGPDANTNVTVTVPDLTSTGLTVGTITKSTGTISGSTWTIPALAANAGAYLAIPVTVSATASGNITIDVPAGTITGSDITNSGANADVQAVIQPY